MILVNQVNCPLTTDFENLIPLAAKSLKMAPGGIRSASLFRKSLDARRKNDLHFCCSLLVACENEAAVLRRNKNAVKYVHRPYRYPEWQGSWDFRPVVTGFGPAGIFAALVLARSGARPIVLERGGSMEERTVAVERFFQTGELDPECNVQFGEGGAGTFSDGKLTTGISDPRCREVLRLFAAHGAGDAILTDAKPHIGTDVLKRVVRSLRREIIALGGEIRFHSRLEGIERKDGHLTAVIANGERISCREMILATGHSARDVFALLQAEKIDMARKPFAAGVRIEHLQREINRAMQGDFAGHPALCAADYKLSVHLENGRGVYTFCMCPGGEVVNASSEAGRVAVNGMSNSRRDGVNANSAVLVNITPEDIPGDDVLGGVEWQRQIEEKAFRLANGGVPVQTLGAFLGTGENRPGRVAATVRPRAVFCSLDALFPSFITESLKQGIGLFDRKIEGFADPDAILTAPESRSSSPVRILRGEDRQSVSLAGLYPCGEGAGYAGGIMSAAVDGMKTAEAVLKHRNEK